MLGCYKKKHTIPKLTIVMPISNPCLFKRREELFGQCLDRLLKFSMNKKINIVVSRLTYVTPLPDVNGITNRVTHNDGYTELDFTAPDILWAKENLINLAIDWIIHNSPDTQYIAWIDSDIQFLNSDWIKKTLGV